MQGLPDRARPFLVQPGAAAAAWAMLASFVVYGSIGPFTGDARHTAALPGISLPDIAQNVLLYVPFGVFGAWALRRHPSSRSALWVRVVAITIGFSGAMEVLQLLSASRIASPLDVLANVVGAGAGAMAPEPIERMLGAVAERMRPTGLLTAPARFVLIAVLAAIVVAAWYPFDVTLDVSTLSHRTRPVRLDPWLSTSTAVLWEQGVRFFVLAALLTVCLPRLGRGAALVAAIAAIGAAIVIDLGQLAMGAHPVGVAVLLSQAGGVCAGAGAAAAAALVRRTWYAAA